MGSINNAHHHLFLPCNHRFGRIVVPILELVFPSKQLHYKFERSEPYQHQVSFWRGFFSQYVFVCVFVRVLVPASVKKSDIKGLRERCGERRKSQLWSRDPKPSSSGQQK